MSKSFWGTLPRQWSTPVVALEPRLISVPWGRQQRRRYSRRRYEVTKRTGRGGAWPIPSAARATQSTSPAARSRRGAVKQGEMIFELLSLGSRVCRLGGRPTPGATDTSARDGSAVVATGVARLAALPGNSLRIGSGNQVGTPSSGHLADHRTGEHWCLLGSVPSHRESSPRASLPSVPSTGSLRSRHGIST